MEEIEEKNFEEYRKDCPWVRTDQDEYTGEILWICSATMDETLFPGVCDEEECAFWYWLTIQGK